MKPNGFVPFFGQSLQIYRSFVLITMSDAGVESISIKLIKKYARVRKEAKLLMSMRYTE